MPYWRLDSTAEPAVKLLQVSPNTFQLLEGFRFQRPAGANPRVLTVPAHDPNRSPSQDNSTDLASVPWFLWWFVSSHGRHTKAALLHDHLVVQGAVERREADLVFREALDDSGVSWPRRWFMWTGVSLATMWDHQRRRLAIFVGHLLVVLALGAMWLTGTVPLLPIDDVPAWWLGIAVALGFGWGVLWPWALVGVVLVGPPTVLVGVSVAIVYLLELIANLIGLIRGDGFELPQPVPYRGRRGKF